MGQSPQDNVVIFYLILWSFDPTQKKKDDQNKDLGSRDEVRIGSSNPGGVKNGWSSMKDSNRDKVWGTP